ncbi:rhodanese-like domain-containing protein [Pseudomonas sp. NPDC007930]|uniref:rhodanese-like domain-containing protein n=1 Tax=Pseudomonas sp. NPDC007930 TaxID=3364417 RepID=UPI0036E2AE93
MPAQHSNTPANASRITAAQLRHRLLQPDEIAVLDVREPGVQAHDGHLLRSVNLSLSTLEQNVLARVPRKGTPIVLVDAGDNLLAGRAAQRLGTLGYRDIAVLEAGVQGWVADGGELFTGTSALSKGFGEYVEQRFGTPHLSAEELKRRLDAGDDILLVDGRTLAEFSNFSIPGAVACPNGELVHRVPALLNSPTTTVVVNCAGRTRSIIGAQTLINAGLENPVLALENGTMDWLAAGFSLQHGVTNSAAKPGQLDGARRGATQLVERFKVREIDFDTLERYRRQGDERSLYVLDVRTLEEYRAGHLPGAAWAEAGQLVQGVDNYVGTQNARVVLVDDTEGLRAAVAASWLEQINWAEVSILRVPAERASEQGVPAIEWAQLPPPAQGITAAALADALGTGQATLLDLQDSLSFAAGHIPGAWFAVRARLPDRAEQLPGDGLLVLTSADGTLAQFAAAELATLLARPIKVLVGGTAAWAAAGLPLEHGEQSLWDRPNDVWRSPYQAAGDRQRAFREYLDWELGLIAQLERDGTARFRHAPAQQEGV